MPAIGVQAKCKEDEERNFSRAGTSKLDFQAGVWVWLHEACKREP
jgi:hypothetical protein